MHDNDFDILLRRVHYSEKKLQITKIHRNGHNIVLSYKLY